MRRKRFLHIFRIYFFFAVSIHEDPGTEPDHTIGLKLFALELRLDYMGTAILMSRVSSLNISLRDEWKVTTRKSSSQILDSIKR